MLLSVNSYGVGESAKHFLHYTAFIDLLAN
jgi:hypothetical protein